MSDLVSGGNVAVSSKPQPTVRIRGQRYAVHVGGLLLALALIVLGAIVAAPMLHYTNALATEGDTMHMVYSSVQNINSALLKGTSLTTIMAHEKPYLPQGVAAKNLTIVAGSCGKSGPTVYTAYAHVSPGQVYAYTSSTQTFRLIVGSNLAAIDKAACK